LKNGFANGERILKQAETSSKITTSIVIPAYDEEIGLPTLLGNVFRCVDGIAEVIVVDDGSRDRTSEVACGFKCSVIKHEANRGKGEALKTGVRHAKGNNIIFIDADNTYPAKAVSQIAEALNFYDIAYAARTIGRHRIPAFNRLGNTIFQRMIRYIYGFPGSDYSTGLYGIKKTYLNAMNIRASGFSIEPEIAIKASRMRLRVGEIPIEYQSRLGKTKLVGPKAGFQHLVTITRLLFWRPSHLR
jgi:glycosyltransferase involved in cell wall biosynthesis